MSIEPMPNNMPPKISMPSNQPVRDEKVIQHQTQLHSKILNIFKPVPHQPNPMGDHGEMSNMDQFKTYNDSNVPTSKNNMVMDPQVQQALDTLMQSSQFRPNVSEQNMPNEESSRNYAPLNNQVTNPYSMNPAPNLRPGNPNATPHRPMVPGQGPGPIGQSYGNNFHGYYQQPQLGQPIYRGRPPFPRPQYPGY